MSFLEWVILTETGQEFIPHFFPQPCKRGDCQVKEGHRKSAEMGEKPLTSLSDISPYNACYLQFEKPKTFFPSIFQVNCMMYLNTQ